ncbi:MAG TPA: hypothetical protein DCQ06_12750 [Myxococcales bacterium]|nr:hypothetical protein [Myxococcales bacterium]HAN32457.1 hypothetical protein [Myxococcales bacterium]
MLSRRQLILAGACCLVGCVSAHQSQPITTASAGVVKRQIAETIIYARRDELERHHLGPALRPWANHATLTLARSAREADTDYTMGYNQVAERMMQTLYGAAGAARRIRYTAPVWTVVGANATFEATLEIADPGAQHWYRERYELWLSDIGWVITACRRWPLRTLIAGRRTKISWREWDRLDHVVAEQRSGTLEQARALWGAHRYAEALRVADKLTQSTPKLAAAWAALGRFSAELGQSKRARMAYQRAFSLEPKLRVPPYKAAYEARSARGSTR